MILGHLATQLDALSSILFADPVSMSQASQWSKTFEMHYKRGEEGRGRALYQEDYGPANGSNSQA